MTPICRHTLHHVKADGSPDGSWVKVTVQSPSGKNSYERIECRYCGQFYGRIAATKPEATT